MPATWKRRARGTGPRMYAALFDALRERIANEPHIFWDSDVGKWIEAAAYSPSFHI